MAKNSLKNQIKEMEAKAREATAPAVQPEAVMSFESWYHQRKDKIAACHRKEILMADFAARGIKKEASMADFDKALEAYGVKIEKK